MRFVMGTHPSPERMCATFSPYIGRNWALPKICWTSLYSTAMAMAGRSGGRLKSKLSALPSLRRKTSIDAGDWKGYHVKTLLGENSPGKQRLKRRPSMFPIPGPLGSRWISAKPHVVRLYGVQSVVKKRSPRVRAMASLRMARLMVYPVQTCQR
jgi:hypothetical protein